MSVLRRPQKVLVAAVQTDAPYFWGSRIQPYGKAGEASVADNRLRRGLARRGSVEVTAPGDGGEAWKGFGPFPPVVIGASIAFRGPEMVRTQSRLRSAPSRRTEYRLGPPVVVNPFVPRTVRPIEGHLAEPRDWVPPTMSRLPQVVVAPVVVVSQAFHGPGVRLADPLSPSFLNRRAVHSKLSGPAVVATPFVARPIEGYLTKPLDRVPRTMSRRRPVTVSAAVSLARPVEVRLALSSRGRPRSRLAPPTVVAPATPDIFAKVHLTYRLRIPRTRSFLRAPVVVRPVLTRALLVHLAYSRRGRTLSILHNPAVVAPVLARPLQAHLAPSSRGKAKSHLSPPTVVGEFRIPVVQVALAYSVRGRPKSKLGAPSVAPASQESFSGPKVTLARRVRVPRTVARLRPVPAAFRPIGFEISVALAASRRGAPKSRLDQPTVVFLAVELLGPETTLVRIRPPRTLAILHGPVVIDLSPQVYSVSINLAPSRRGVPKSILRRPTDLVDQADTGSLRVQLAYSRRGKAKPRLAPPTVVAPILARPTAIYLAPSSRGVPKSRLEPPVVVFPFIARPTRLTLVRIRPVPTRSFLHPPTDLVDRSDLGLLRVHLTYSQRGTPKSRLKPPTVVAPVLARPVVTKLARIRPVATRSHLAPPTVVRLAVELSGPRVTLVRIRPPHTFWFLRPPVAGAAQPKAETTLLVTLAPQRRGKPRSFLRAPVVVGSSVVTTATNVTLVRIRPRVVRSVLRRPTAAVLVFRGPLVTLAPSRRGTAKSFRLGPPELVGRSDLGLIRVYLAPSSRGYPKSILREPSVVGPVLARAIKATLAPSRRGAPKSHLYRPVVVQAFVVPTIRVTLSPSSRGAPKSGLGEPVVLNANTAYPQGPMVQLAPQKRGVPKSILKPPTVVAPAGIVTQGRVVLALIRPARVRSFLRAPMVIDLRPQTSFLSLTLVRIRPPLTRWFLKLPTAVTEECYGTVVGFDFSAEVCGSDSAATISGSESASTVSGSDSGATVQGASAPGGSVTGGDERTEGC